MASEEKARRPTAVTAPDPSRRGRIFAVVGGGLQMGFLFGVTSVTFQCIRALKGLNYRAVVSFESFCQTYILGLGAGLLGIIFIWLALGRYRYRAEWFFWFLLGYGCLLIFIPPLGLPAGLLLLRGCWKRRKEFAGQAAAEGDGIDPA